MEKQKIEKEGNTNYKHINVLIHRPPWPPSRLIQHLKKLAQKGPGKSVPECFVREKKWTNKGTDKLF